MRVPRRIESEKAVRDQAPRTDADGRVNCPEGLGEKAEAATNTILIEWN